MPFHLVVSMGDISMISFFNFEIVEIGDFLRSIVFFFGVIRGRFTVGVLVFSRFVMEGQEGGRVVIASITGFRFSGGKECDFGSTTRVGLVSFWENLLFQI